MVGLAALLLVVFWVWNGMIRNIGRKDRGIIFMVDALILSLLWYILINLLWVW